MITLQQILRDLSDEGRKGIIFSEAGKEDVFCSYTDLYMQSLRLLGGLQSFGIKKTAM